MTAAELIKQLLAETAKNPKVADYTIISSNAPHQKFEVRHDGQWIMLGRLK
jgi:hypothetical protein